MKEKKQAELVTKFGPIPDDDELHDLDRRDFMAWVRENRHGRDLSEKEWIVLYKHSLAQDYAARYFNIAERIDV